MRRAMRVEYPGSIYDVMDCWDSREDILIIGTAKGAESVLHRSGRGQHCHKPARAEEPCAQLEFQSTVCPLSAFAESRRRRWRRTQTGEPKALPSDASVEK
jgi:hypothetical protein